jgi:hypothetical protein
MTPAGLQCLTEGVTALRDTFGMTYMVLTGPSINQTFQARVYETRVIDPEMPLGADPRMASILSIVQPKTVTLQAQDLVRSENLTRYKILKLVDNRETSPSIDYEVEQQV